MVGSVRLLVVQPTPFCNLDCDYCYLPDRGDRSRLSFPVLEAAVERVLDSPYFGGEFTLLWHAAAPELLPGWGELQLPACPGAPAGQPDQPRAWQQLD